MPWWLWLALECTLLVFLLVALFINDDPAHLDAADETASYDETVGQLSDKMELEAARAVVQTEENERGLDPV